MIGNSAYDSQSGWGYLNNQVSDAEAMRQVLEDILGFDQVIMKKNLDRKDFGHALDGFESMLNKGDTAFFFYSGHGAQADDQNYLIPTSAGSPNNSRRLRADSIALSEVMGLLNDKRTALNIVVLDACRNNPLKSNKSFGGAGLKGLRRTKLKSETLIGFATAPGSYAADGRGDLSPYTQALTETLVKPGMSLWEVFGQVGALVEERTKDSDNPQVPWKSDTLSRAHYLLEGTGGEGVELLSFTVKPNPWDARVRILNIGPKYRDGMKLKPDSYKVEVSKPGYQRSVALFDLKRGQEVYAVELEQQRDKPTAASRVSAASRPIVSASRKPFEPEMVRIAGGSFQIAPSRNRYQVGNGQPTVAQTVIPIPHL